MTEEKKIHTNERGISLLIVLLVGTIMLFTSLAIGQYALRMVTSIRARSEATQTLYTAEQAFECVKYWLNKDYRHFSTIGGGLTSECNGATFDFSTLTDSATDGVNPTYNAGTGIGTFRIPFDSADPTRGGVVVEVERSDPSLQLFDGLVRVYSQSDAETANKTSERFQEYHYRVLYGADIMFVVDRSGSIDDDDDRTDRTTNPNNEWNTMLTAVNDSIRLLNVKVPAPLMGIVSFGTNADDTGQLAADCSGAGCNWREADQKLTANINDLIDDNGSVGDLTDDFPNMELGKAATNLSLGITIAGAELMGKYYPHTGETDPPLVSFGAGKYSGEFERIVADNDTFNLLPDQDSPMDRNDAEFPDVIVVLTDGAPNGIMTHKKLDIYWFHSAITSLGDPDPLKFITPVSYNYKIGEVKLFRTDTGGAGELVVDDNTAVLIGSPVIPAPCHAYIYCNDNVTIGSQKPNDVFAGSAPLDQNEFPHMAMCNTTLIADKFKADEGTIFIVVYVGNDDTTDEALWLREYLASQTTDGDPLFAMINDYSELRDALLYLFEQLDFLKTR